MSQLYSQMVLLSCSGTPGEANPGWDGLHNFVSLWLVAENPSNGVFSVAYQSSSQPLEAFLYDLTGRVVSRLDLQPGLPGTLSADLSGNCLPAFTLCF